eukprot:CAMPEP_0170618690 /NCGR_PEP_ID=MMETSP0224-20130122/27093_1 /TAXON_ID=285029 /ORGANISM="Togula jolla, Strain CCCM 725" /LENGTH=183 /DNA_ID=CAMNT_0010944681 /DNA_START=113 /DNA_END=664 /DNA_ORIENTATION=+
MPSSDAGPTPYVKSRAPFMLALLLAQSAVCGLRLVLLLDIMGGFIMAIMVGLGWYAWKESMHITFVSYWGFMCLINGCFDLVKFVDYWVKSPMPLFSSELSAGYNLMSGTVILIPLVTLPGALLAYYMYKSQSEADTGIYGGGGGQEERASLWSGGGASAGRIGRGSGNFQAFGGSGQRLGAQ